MLPHGTVTARKTHNFWYVIGFLSALIMGMSAFVISYNFMLGRVPLIIVIACASAGMLLNTTLYWVDSAKKLSEFTKSTMDNPRSLLSREALLSFASALCVGFLALKSYIDQFSALPPSLLQAVPFWTLSITFSLANSISTFVLFYEPASTEAVADSAPNSQQSSPSRYLANFIGISQSCMYALTNLLCVQQVLTLLAPSISHLAWGVSIPLALALLLAECDFNCEKMQKVTTPDESRYWTQPTLQSGLYSLVGLNAFANGWIALGDLIHLPVALQWSIVSIGSIVSYSVMKDNLRDINRVIFDPVANRQRFIPEKNEDLQNATIALLQAISLTSGAYFLAYPLVFEGLMTTMPIITTMLFAAFSYNFLTLSLYGCTLAKQQMYTAHTSKLNSSNTYRSSQLNQYGPKASSGPVSTSWITSFFGCLNFNSANANNHSRNP